MTDDFDDYVHPKPIEITRPTVVYIPEGTQYVGGYVRRRKGYAETKDTEGYTNQKFNFGDFEFFKGIKLLFLLLLSIVGFIVFMAIVIFIPILIFVGIMLGFVILWIKYKRGELKR